MSTESIGSSSLFFKNIDATNQQTCNVNSDNENKNPIKKAYSNDKVDLNSKVGHKITISFGNNNSHVGNPSTHNNLTSDDIIVTNNGVSINLNNLQKFNDYINYANYLKDSNEAGASWKISELLEKAGETAKLNKSANQLTTIAQLYKKDFSDVAGSSWKAQEFLDNAIGVAKENRSVSQLLRLAQLCKTDFSDMTGASWKALECEDAAKEIMEH